MNHKGWLKALGAFILVFVYVVLIFLLLMVIGEITEFYRIDLSTTATKPGKLLLLIIMISSSLLVIRTFEGEWNISGLGLIKKLNMTLYDVTSGLVLGVFLFIVFLSINLLFESVVIIDVDFDLSEFVYMLILFMLVSFNEEIFIRGLVQRYLYQSFDSRYSLVIASILFALMHIANPNISVIGFIHLIISGLILGAIYFLTKSLWFSIAYHFSWNTFQSIFGFRVSGQDSYSILDLTIKDRVWLNGGEFGAEGSTLLLFMQMLTGVLLICVYKKRLFFTEKPLS